MSDLPEPIRPKFTVIERRERRWRVIFAALVIVTFYTQVHKVLVPLVLKLTPLSTSPYSHVDWWFLHSIFLVVVLRGAYRTTPFAGFLAGVGIGYAIFETKLAMEGAFPGWLTISRLLSSIPMAIVCAFLLSFVRGTKNIALAWAGALGFFAVVVVYAPVNPKAELVTGKVPPSAAQPTAVPVIGCGADSVILSKDAATESVVYVHACGFQPSTIAIGTSPVEVINEREEPINIHVIGYDGKRKSNLINLLIPASGRRTLPSLKLKGNVAMLYSDSHPKVGVVGLWSEGAEGEWTLTRKPIEIRKR